MPLSLVQMCPILLSYKNKDEVMKNTEIIRQALKDVKKFTRENKDLSVGDCSGDYDIAVFNAFIALAVKDK